MLDVPASPRTRVFRELVAILREDPLLSRVIRKDALRTWDGSPLDAKDFTIEHAPALRLTPVTSGDDFATPDSMKGGLLINCEILLRGTRVDDLADFWWAVCKAVYPDDLLTRNAIALRLQNAGARSGLVLFSQPAMDPDPDGVFVMGMAQIKIDIESRFN